MRAHATEVGQLPVQNSGPGASVVDCLAVSPTHEQTESSHDRCLILVDATQLPVVREVRDQYVNTQQPPASTAVEVWRLVRDDLLIEVEAVAVIASFQPMTAPA